MGPLCRCVEQIVDQSQCVSVARLSKSVYTYHIVQLRETTTMNENQYLVNRFILFYTLRLLWKENKRETDDLYATLFTSRQIKGNNKTLYDRILRLDDTVNLFPQTKRLAHVTGVPEKYFLGERQYKVTVSNDPNEYATWKLLIDLRQQRGGGQKKKSQELKDTEAQIRNWILEASKDENIKQMSEVFSRLVTFAKLGKKRSEYEIDDVFSEIEAGIDKCSRQLLVGASSEQLAVHYAKLMEYVHRVKATQILKDWK